ncbi:MAG: DUF6092 family protein [Bacillota bacterium]
MKPLTYENLGHLLCYLASSARGLLDEPAPYGPFRLIDAVSRLIKILEAEDPEDEVLVNIRTFIDNGKYLLMTDMDAFKKVLDDTVIALATWLDRK